MQPGIGRCWRFRAGIRVCCRSPGMCKVKQKRACRLWVWQRASRWAAALLMLLGSVPIAGQSAASQGSATEELMGLAAAGQWQEIVRRLTEQAGRSADAEFYYGTALAHLGRYIEADSALGAGERLAPRDPRFPVERAGIAFERKRYPLAAHFLRRAVRLAPADSYTNDFLGTVYFLEDNLPASLKYWNRVGKPQIASVREEPVPRVSPALLDRAFVFSPAAELTLSEFVDSLTRVRGLGIFAQDQFDLRAKQDGAFDLVFRDQEKNGFGDTKFQALAVLLRDLPFQGVTPEYDNIGRRAINAGTLLRWDAEKRRAFLAVSGPFEHSAKFRSAFSLDLRTENWVLRNGFTGYAPVMASLNQRRGSAGIGLASYASDRLRWNAGAEVSYRDFRNVQPGTVLTSSMLASGYQLKQTVGVGGTLLRIPERRFAVDADGSSVAARLWARPGSLAEKLQGSIGWHWLPRAVGDDYAMRQEVRAGKTFGQVPFDELFMLGLERDNDLPMHAHIGTRDGRKGSAPLGRNYFLDAWETDKNIYANGLLTLKFGPLLDIGKITDPGTELGSHEWLFDLGAQIKVRVFSTTVALSYGRDLRTGNNAFYAALVP
jgi:tetratricopeptide (TPR) repeat protein